MMAIANSSAGYRWLKMFVGVAALATLFLAALFFLRSQVAGGGEAATFHLTPGMTRDEIVTLCGQPDNIRATGDGSQLLLKYERPDITLELFLIDGKLESWREIGTGSIRRQSMQGGCCS